MGTFPGLGFDLEGLFRSPEPLGPCQGSQPKTPSIGSGQSSDLITTGTGKSVQSPTKLLKQEVLRM